MNPVVAPEGHENYLKGRYYWNKRSHKNLTRAIGYFFRSVVRLWSNGGALESFQ